MNDMPPGCSLCRDQAEDPLGIPITMALQPIVDIRSGTIFAHEALVRGMDGAGAEEIFARVGRSGLYSFDQHVRVTAIELAARLGISAPISINFMPNAVYNPVNCLRRTLWAAEKYGFPLSKIIFEITEHERVTDIFKLKEIIEVYRRNGLRTAIDDFGAGFAGLGLLAQLQPDIIKIDRELVHGIALDRNRRAIVTGLASTALALDITVVAEGIELPEDRDTLLDLGITLQQGYLFARPRLGQAWDASDLGGLDCG